jgi:hypothetical protein
MTATNDAAWIQEDARPMTTPIVTERGRLTALRAAALFDGTSGALVRNPLVLIDDDTIVAADSGVPTPKAPMLPTWAA